MNTTGRAKGPGPHRTHVRETQKRGVVRQARRASRSAAFGLRPGTGPAGFIGKRMAVSSGQARESPQRLNPSASAISPGAVLTRQRPRQRAVPSSAFAPCGSETRGVTRGRAQPLPVQRPCATARVLVRCASWRPQAGKARPPRKGRSAPGPREALRDQIVAGVHAVHRDRGKRPPIGVGAEPRDHDPPARQ